MSTLSPVGRYGGGRRWRHIRTALVLLVGIGALVAAGWIGWSLAGRNSNSASPSPSSSVSTTTSASCTPSASVSSTTTASGTAAAHPSSTALPKAKTITVNVYNSTSHGGLARSTAKDLSARGFTIGTVANDPAPKPVLGVAEVRFGPKGRQEAIVVAAQVHGATLVLDKRKTTDVDLAVGAQYKHLATPAQVKAALSPSAKPTPSC